MRRQQDLYRPQRQHGRRSHLPFDALPNTTPIAEATIAQPQHPAAHGDRLPPTGVVPVPQRQLHLGPNARLMAGRGRAGIDQGHQRRSVHPSLQQCRQRSHAIAGRPTATAVCGLHQDHRTALDSQASAHGIRRRVQRGL